jgi:hypothetical protein
MMPGAFFGENGRWERTLTQSDKGVAFFNNTLVRLLVVISLVPVLLGLGLLAYFVRPNEASIVLHYNVYFGVDLLGVWWQAYMLPFIGFCFLLGHFFLAKRFYQSAERIACYLVLLASGMFSFGTLIAGISIAFINY